MNTIFIETSPEQIKAYVNSPKGDQKHYFGYNLQLFKKPFSDGGIYQNQDVWRLHEGNFYEINNNIPSRPIYPYSVVTCGEWECAIRIDNSPDAIGGFHGYEKKIKVSAEADGIPVFPGEKNSITAEKFIFTQESEIYRQTTKNEVLAYHIKNYCFSNGKMNIHQEIIWQKEIQVLHAYLAMLPIRRTSDDTDSGIQITDRVSVNTSNKEYDITKIGHNTEISTPAHTVSDVTKALIWGNSSKITAEMQVKDQINKDNYFFVQNTQEYNKLYYSPLGKKDVYNTKKDECWQIDSTYEIYQKK